MIFTLTNSITEGISTEKQKDIKGSNWCWRAVNRLDAPQYGPEIVRCGWWHSWDLCLVPLAADRQLTVGVHQHVPKTAYRPDTARVLQATGSYWCAGARLVGEYSCVSVATAVWMGTQQHVWGIMLFVSDVLSQTPRDIRTVELCAHSLTPGQPGEIENRRSTEMSTLLVTLPTWSTFCGLGHSRLCCCLVFAVRNCCDNLRRELHVSLRKKLMSALRVLS